MGLNALKAFGSFFSCCNTGIVPDNPFQDSALWLNQFTGTKYAYSWLGNYYNNITIYPYNRLCFN